MALADETRAVACLLQPGTEILAVGFEFRIGDGETPNRTERIVRDEVLAGVARGPATGHQGVARGSTHGRRGKSLSETDAGPSQGVECWRQAITALEAKEMAACHVIDINDDHIGAGSGGLSHHLVIERVGPRDQFKLTIRGEVEVAGAHTTRAAA